MPVSPRINGVKGDEALDAENKATLSAKLQAYDAIPNKQKYLTGNVTNLYSTAMERDG